MKDKNTQEEFASAWASIQALAVEIATKTGWYDGEFIATSSLCLLHSEISEIVEALRIGDPQDEKCPEFRSSEVEAADLVIRIMDMANRMGWRLPQAMAAKMEYNKTRPYRHNKLF